MQRTCGILAHPTSFPSRYGIGDLGASAYQFVDFLSLAEQSLWQVLPLGPTSYGDSPYQSFSTFAGNPYLISPDELVKQQYLTEADVADVPAFDPHTVDYGPVIIYKMALYRKAFAQFQTAATRKQQADFTKFCTQHKAWLDDYALFVAIKNHFIAARRYETDSPAFAAYREENAPYLTENQINDYYYGAVWTGWPSPIARREPEALSALAAQLADDIAFNKFLQYEFFRQWDCVKTYANRKGIRIIGDLPIFVAMDSSDVWANPNLYCLNEDLRPTVVAGVPPDYFSETGQLWGNPLYDWEAHKATGYAWWIQRLENELKRVDIVRIDHFRGFESYWSVPYGETTAVNGKWKKGPGKALFTAIKKQLGHLPIIAEDLGIITEKVTRLRESLKLPGMRVLQFAFDPDGKNIYMPHNYTETNTVVYTGTHDNDTTQGWYAGVPEEQKDYFRRYMNVSGEDAAWDLIRLAYSATADTAVVPIQDVMNLGTEARMNQPGIPAGNWRFRYTADMLTEPMAARLQYLTALFNRLPAREAEKP